LRLAELPPGFLPMKGRPMNELQSDYQSAMASLRGGDFAAALATMQAMSESLPGNEQVLRALRQLGHEAAQAAMALSPDSDEALDRYRWALAAYLAMGRTITDRQDCALLRAVCFNVGALYHRRKLYDLAIQHYRDALVLGPEASDTPTNLADVLTEAGRPSEAIDVVDAALRFHPDLPQLKHQKAMALRAVGLVAEKGAKSPY
jgi:tetratricopeptide (TPR) repeat protein